MLIPTSSVKALDYQSPLTVTRHTLSELLDHSQQLIHVTRQLPTPQISKLMGTSDELAGLNATRFHDWQPNFTLDNVRQAILTFKGDAYTGLQAETLGEADFDLARQRLWMLSGLYGVLHPLNLIRPYRLRMGICLANVRGKGFYQFWGNTTTDKLNEALEAQGDSVVINLASSEYFKSVKPKELNAELVKPVFLDERNGKFRVVSPYVEKAHDLMGRYITENHLARLEQLTTFSNEGYSFDEEASGSSGLVFKRYKQQQGDRIMTNALSGLQVLLTH